jgi:glycosyltransferase involved in cell wall biosynthesis
MDNRQVTVVIVTYNAADTLQQCLDSIYLQQSTLIDIIVIDGYSTDGTQNIIADNNEQIFFWISEADQGIYDAMNKAINHIRTPWVFFLGADDTLLSEFSGLIPELQDPSKIYYANVIYKNAIHSGLVSPYYQAKSGIFHQSILYPLVVFKKYKYNIKYKIAADYALNMVCYGDKDFSFQYLNYTIAKYNDTGISSVEVDNAFEKDKSKLIFTNFGLKIWSRYFFRRLKARFKKL